MRRLLIGLLFAALAVGCGGEPNSSGPNAANPNPNAAPGDKAPPAPKLPGKGGKLPPPPPPIKVQ
jgi:hypothetical protein